MNQPTGENAGQDSQVFDPFRMYLYEISKHPVLSREEEREVAERMRVAADSEAEQKLVVSNLRLVVKIALDYCSYHLNVLDLVQEGNMGLLRAVKKFDPERGTRFSTYASFWIRAYILKYLMDSWSMVKVGTKDSQRKLFYSLNKEKERLEKAGIMPTAQVLAENLEVSVADVEEMEKRLYNGDVSLEDPLYGGGDEIIDTIGSDEDIEETVAEKEKGEIIRRILAEFKELLNEKERFILEKRIMAEDPVTLRQIGERFGTSRESIRQLQVKISRNLTKNLRAGIIWS
ncbi:MAG: sigma-70 family RNA polymerase sigma factor [Syntrophorhabdales bacterium]|jgi:RNA polymerase sigma-32 factor